MIEKRKIIENECLPFTQVVLQAASADSFVASYRWRKGISAGLQSTPSVSIRIRFDKPRSAMSGNGSVQGPGKHYVLPKLHRSPSQQVSFAICEGVRDGFFPKNSEEQSRKTIRISDLQVDSPQRFSVVDTSARTRKKRTKVAGTMLLHRLFACFSDARHDLCLFRFQSPFSSFPCARTAPTSSRPSVSSRNQSGSRTMVIDHLPVAHRYTWCNTQGNMLRLTLVGHGSRVLSLSLNQIRSLVPSPAPTRIQDTTHPMVFELVFASEKIEAPNCFEIT